jgi:ribose 1,5-bisphosphate isomerase
MEQLLKDAERIKSLEIQGATKVATSAIQFLSDYAHRIGKKMNNNELYLKLLEAKEILAITRATEPALRNGLNYVLNRVKNNLNKLPVDKLLDHISYCNKEFRELVENAKNNIAKIGARRIPDGEKNDVFTIFTHCHSSVVARILLEAKRQGKNSFKVISTETRPRYQGRKTTKKLLDAGIEVIHVVDSAMRWAVNYHEVDLILIGADSITSEGTIINKIGSRLLALVAHEEHVPFYVASPLLKYNPQTSFGNLEKIEMRDPREIWENAPKGLKILNPAFETVSRRYIDGLITEAGIFASSHVHNYFTKLYPELIVGDEE